MNVLVAMLWMSAAMVLAQKEVCTTSSLGAPDVFFINLDRSANRRTFMERRLKYFNLHGLSHRVRAYVPEDIFVPSTIKVPDECKVFSGKVALSSIDQHRVFVDGHCGRPKNSKRELTTTTSHLGALYEATHSSNTSTSSPYALILEDDLELAFEIDWPIFFQSLPPDAVMLQLVTSNERDVAVLYSKYKKSGGKHVWHKRLDKNDFWCAGAYIVHKERLRPVIDRIVRTLGSAASSDGSPKLAMTVLAGYSRPCFPKLCCSTTTVQMHPQEHGFGGGYENLGKFVIGGSTLVDTAATAAPGSSAPSSPLSSTTHQACIFAARGYQADHYIFSLARRFTYMLSVPLVAGAGVGNVSTLHQEHVSMHVGAFARIDAIQRELHAGAALPTFAKRTCSRFDV
jgi:hypothetical protein